jgi:hypothetical protein
MNGDIQEGGSWKQKEPTAHTKQTAQWGVIAGVILFAVFAVAAWAFFLQTQEQTAPQNLPLLPIGEGVVTLSDEKTADITGTLLLSLLPKEQSSGSISVQKQYAYDLNTNTLAQLPTSALFPNEKESDVHIMYYDISSDGSWVTFAGFTKSEYEESYDAYGAQEAVRAALQIYRAQVANGTYANVEKLTNNRAKYKRAPNISNDGQVLYVAVAEDTEYQPFFFVSAEEWEVHYINESGEDTTLERGLYPKWLTNDTFVVLKNDGIHWRSLPDSSGHLIAGKTGAQTNTMFDASDNGLFFVWTIPDEQSLHVYQVTGEMESGRPVLTPVGTMQNVMGFWPILSPDGRFIAFQFINPKMQDINPEPRLTILETQSLQPAPNLVDLDGFEQQNMFVNDWR